MFIPITIGTLDPPPLTPDLARMEILTLLSHSAAYGQLMLHQSKEHQCRRTMLYGEQLLAVARVCVQGKIGLSRRTAREYDRAIKVLRARYTLNLNAWALVDNEIQHVFGCAAHQSPDTIWYWNSDSSQLLSIEKPHWSLERKELIPLLPKTPQLHEYQEALREHQEHCAWLQERIDALEAPRAPTKVKPSVSLFKHLKES